MKKNIHLRYKKDHKILGLSCVVTMVVITLVPILRHFMTK